MSEIRANTVSDAAGTGPATLTGQSANKAWFDYDQAANSVRSSFNISSFSDDSTGDFKANFTSAMSDANYPVTASTLDSTTNGVNGIMWLVGHDDAGSTPSTFTASQCRFGAYFYPTSRIDATHNKALIGGDLA